MSSAEDLGPLLDLLAKKQLRRLLEDACKKHPSVLEALKREAKEGYQGPVQYPEIPAKFAIDVSPCLFDHTGTRGNSVSDRSTSFVLHRAEMLTHRVDLSKFAGYVASLPDTSVKNVFYVEFDTDESAKTALHGLQHFKVTPETPMLITFTKRPP